MSPEDWYKSLPPVTRVWWSIAVGFTLLSTFGVINPYYMFLNSDLVFGKFQIWRLITCFLYFGPLSFPVIFSLVLLVRYCGLLEGQFGTHLNGTADLLVMLLFGMVNIWVLDYLFLGYGLYGMPLVFMCIYVWSRKDPFGEFSFYGFTFKQWHVPFLFTVAGMLYGGNPILDLVGIGIGHFYYFLLEIVPLNWGYRLLWTPDWMIQGVKMAQQRFATGPPAQANTAMPRPHWQMGVGHRLG